MAENSQPEVLKSISSNSTKFQFGRIIEVDIYNYNTGKVIKIPNALSISFEFYKSTDEVKKASTGFVTVKNLSEATFDMVRTANACQMILRAGYSGSVGTIFFADITSCRQVNKGGNSEVVFNVSANYFEYRLNYGLNYTNNNSYTINQVLMGLVDLLNERKNEITGVKIKSSFRYLISSNYSQSDVDKVIEYLVTAKMGEDFAFSGTLEKVMNDIGDAYGLSIFADKDTSKTTYNVTFKDNYINYYLNKANENYEKITSKNNVSSSLIYDASSENKAIVLSYDTGLLGTPSINYKVFTVPENYKGLKTDEVTLKSQIALNARALKKAELEKKATSSKEPVKPKKTPTKSIKKAYISAEAQLNPDIRPQSIIKLELMDDRYNGYYRVRNVQYKGDNVQGDFKVSMFLEDTNGANDVTATESDIKEFKEKNVGVDDTVQGQLGSDYNQSTQYNDGESSSSDSTDKGGDAVTVGDI